MKSKICFSWNFIFVFSLVILSLAGGPLRGADFIRGDVNGDGVVTLSDAHAILLFVEFGREAPECLNAADVNDDGEVSWADAKELIDDIFKYLGGINLKAPFPGIGPDPTPNDDPLVKCPSYGGGAPLEIEVAQLKVLDDIVPGGTDSEVFITLSILNSRNIAGYWGTIQADPLLFETVNEKPTNLAANSAAQYKKAELRDGLLHYGQLSSSYYERPIRPGAGSPDALGIKACLKPGTPAGEYELTLASGEFIDFETGRAIHPVLLSGVLIVLEDVAAEPECGAIPPPPPPPPPPPAVTYKMEDRTAKPGDQIEVPFYIHSEVGIEGYMFSLDFDEEILQVVEVERVWKKPEGLDPEYGFSRFEYDNSNDHPGSGGVDEGFIIGAAVFMTFGKENDVTMPANTDNTALRFHFKINEEAAPGSTTLKFLDGGQISGQPTVNVVTALGMSISPESSDSFILLGSEVKISILPDIAVFVRGDANADNSLDISDATAILAHMFLGDNVVPCPDAADINDSGDLDVTDAIYLLDYLFLGGLAPPPPFPVAGTDPTDDQIHCSGEI